MKELPRYDITIDPEYKDGDKELGIEMIAFTSRPAIKVKGIAFKAAEKKQYFADDKKYRITAPAMIPMDIYREDEDGEYEVTFDEKVIDQMHAKLMSNLKNQDLFNLEHEGSEVVPAYILEAWVVDNPEKDKSKSTFGIDVPKGTLMLTAQVTDKEYYEKLVSGEKIGFSIEGHLGLKMPEAFAEVIKNESDMKLPDGEHMIEGKIYVVKDGEVIEIRDELPAEMEEDKKEEPVEAAEPPVEEPKEEEMAVDPEADKAAIEAIVAPMIEAAMTEVLQVIADLRAELEGAAEEAAPAEPVMMSDHGTQTMYSKLTKFMKDGEEV